MSFLVRYPEFANVDKARIELALQDAENQMSRKIWGNKFEQGRDALAAHLLYVSGALTKSGHSNGNPMVATSKSAGGLSVGYANKNAGLGENYGAYGTSDYGVTYYELRKQVGVHVMVVP